MRFPNKAGDHADTDEILAAELEAAGIDVIRLEALRRSPNEVVTAIRGDLHGWMFVRQWYYWSAHGPGIEIATAQRLQDFHGKTLRANGDCACRGPLFWNKGLATGSYHIDDAAGLKALADAIRELTTHARREEG